MVVLEDDWHRDLFRVQSLVRQRGFDPLCPAGFVGRSARRAVYEESPVRDEPLGGAAADPQPSGGEAIQPLAILSGLYDEGSPV
jgi:hypothetical protein